MDAKEQERKELGILTNEPIKIIIGGRERMMPQPTLAVLDEVSKIAIDLPTIDTDLTPSKMISEARALMPKAARKMSKAIGIALAGERYFKIYGKLLAWWYGLDVYIHATPKELKNAAQALTVNGGLVDFILSMQLMSIARTTKPTESIE